MSWIVPFVQQIEPGSAGVEGVNLRSQAESFARSYQADGYKLLILNDENRFVPFDQVCSNRSGEAVLFAYKPIEDSAVEIEKDFSIFCQHSSKTLNFKNGERSSEAQINSKGDKLCITADGNVSMKFADRKGVIALDPYPVNEGLKAALHAVAARESEAA